jgi:hypothetical protein
MFLEHLEGIQSLVKKQHNGPWLMTLIDFMMLTVLLSFLLQGTICNFMQFPSGITERVVTDMTDLTEYAAGVKLRTQNSCSSDVDVLKKLAAVSSQLNACKVGDKVVSASNFYFIIQFHSSSLSHAFVGADF